jgi:hypothetical protein
VSILLGKGDGTFQPAQSYASSHSPGIVMVGDFNGDGIPDLALANNRDGTDGGSVDILLGNGDGTFQARKSYAVANLSTATVGDFNGDGHLDLAVTFQAAESYDVGYGPSLAVADFNGDGILDLAVNDGTNPGTVAILLGNGDGTFRVQSYFLAVVAISAVGDFNGDGFPDLISGGAGVTVLLNDAHWGGGP